MKLGLFFFYKRLTCNLPLRREPGAEHLQGSCREGVWLCRVSGCWRHLSNRRQSPRSLRTLVEELSLKRQELLQI